MEMFPRRLLMAEDLPTPAKGIYTFLEFIALGFILVGVEELIRRGSWGIFLSALALGAVFLFVGVMGRKMKDKVLAWVRAPQLLANALADNASLKKRL